MLYRLWREIWQDLLNINLCKLLDPEIPLLGVYTGKILTQFVMIGTGFCCSSVYNSQLEQFSFLPKDDGLNILNLNNVQLGK